MAYISKNFNRYSIQDADYEHDGLLSNTDKNKINNLDKKIEHLNDTMSLKLSKNDFISGDHFSTDKEEDKIQLINLSEDMKNTIIAKSTGSDGAKGEAGIDAKSVETRTPSDITTIYNTGYEYNGKVHLTKNECFGVRWEANQTNYTGTRLYGAQNLIAQPSTDNVEGINDFDNIYPWRDMIRCNGKYNEDGEFVVTVYDGEPGFKKYGGNGNVWVEIPKFYVKETIKEDGSEEWVICKAKLAGYRLPEKFKNIDGTEKDKAYISAYMAGLNSDNKLSSISNVRIQGGYSYNTFLTKVQELGDKYTGYTVEDDEIIRLLFCIEYATRNTQSVMMGYANGNNSNCPYYSDDYQQSRLGMSGRTDSVLGPSGSPTDNTSGYYPCRYRYIEDPWGHGSRIMYGLVRQNYNLYYCKDKSKYGTMSTDLLNSNYTTIGYELSNTDGWIKSLGYDENYPGIRYASVVGGTNATYYTDYYYRSAQSSNSIYEFLMGGALNDGLYAGLFRVLVYNTIGGANWAYSSRLSI